MWLLAGNNQYVTFIDPHGLHDTGPGDARIKFSDDIKNVERRIDDPDIVLNSFIVSPTNKQKLDWGEEDDWFRENHILFMNDENYVNQLFDTLPLF
jgi:hypothetical protein